MSEVVTRQLTKFESARLSFVTIIRHKNDMEEKIMALLKHPDATTDQIVMARELLLGLEEPLRRVITALREQYPYPTFSTLTRPWHKPEYDKYDQKIMGSPTADAREGEGNNQTNKESKDGV